MKNIEVEFRAIISKNKYLWLNNFLKLKGQDSGQDDKDTVFYIFPDKLLKVVNEISKNKAKIVLKNGHIGKKNNLEEIEVEISPKNYKNAIAIFNCLNLSCKTTRAFQKRHNYKYKNVEISIKFSEEWQYHVEMEVTIHNLNKKKGAEEKIKKIAKELGVKLMTKEEIKSFTQKFEEKIKNL